MLGLPVERGRKRKKNRKIPELQISGFHIGLVYASVCGPNRVSAVDLTDTDWPETTEARRGRALTSVTQKVFHFSREQALGKGELDTQEKRQKAAGLFSNESGKTIQRKVIDTWHRNHKTKKAEREGGKGEAREAGMRLIYLFIMSDTLKDY